MWKIKESKHENELLDFIQMSNGAIRAAIYPNLGGSLQELSLDQVKIIDGIRPDERGLQDYRNTYRSSILFPFPNRVKDGIYAYGGNRYKLGINDLAFNNAIHGLVHDKHFVPEVVENTQDRIRLKLTFSADGSDPGFPFAYELGLIYTLETSGVIKLTFDLHNTGFQTFPFGMGWHPYFFSSNLDKSRIAAAFKDHFICPERMIPDEKEEASLDSSFEIGDQSFDDGFTLEEATSIFETPDYTVSMNFDSGSEPFLQIYTPEDRNSIAIEPMTCLTDALNNGIGLEALDPGQSYQWSIEMKVAVKS